MLKRKLKRKLLETNSRGFSLIELLIVIIIIGLLAAIALPSFLNATNNARIAEAESAIRNINQRQVIRLNRGQNFATTLAELGGGIQSESAAYNYSVSITGSDVNQAALAIAAPKSPAVEPVQGRVALIIDSSGERATITLVCRTDQIASVPTDSAVCPNP